MATPELDPVVTIAPLLQGVVTIDSKTITAYLQLAFSAGYYTVGGVPAGIAAYMNEQTVNTSNPLWAEVHSEDPFVTSLGSGGFTYLYNFSTDTIQIFDGPAQAGNELTASEPIPAGVLNDTIVGKFTYDRNPL